MVEDLQLENHRLENYWLENCLCDRLDHLWHRLEIRLWYMLNNHRLENHLLGNRL
jgi:hypothetical protein